MARQEQDREDILREATALVDRAEFTLPGYPDPIVAGFRRDGAPSFYFGTDLVLQFNAGGAFRRGFEHGRLLKADRGRLVSLRRTRDEQQVTLHSHELSPEELTAFRGRMLERLNQLRDSLRCGTAQLVRQVSRPVDGQPPRHPRGCTSGSRAG